VQGRLRKKSLSVVVKTECAYCSEPLTLDIDSELNCKVREKGADPLIFIPDVKIDVLKDPNIIEAF